MTATAERLATVEEEFLDVAASLARVAEGVHTDAALFVAVTYNTKTVNPHILHGLQADLDKIEREARILRFLLTELEGE